MERILELNRLNDTSRIVDDPIQWILEKRGVNYGKFGPWKPRSYCTTQKALTRCIREHVGAVAPEILAFVETWPDRHTPGAVGKSTNINMRRAA